MDFLRQSFQVDFSFPVFFTEHLFSPGNPVIRQFLESQQSVVSKKLLFIIDEGVIQNHQELAKEIHSYVSATKGYILSDIVVLPGGENCKNQAVPAIEQKKILRKIGVCLLV